VTPNLTLHRTLYVMRRARRWHPMVVLRTTSVLACVALILSGCVSQPDGADWHRTPKATIQVCVPLADAEVKAQVVLYRNVDPELLRRGFSDRLGEGWISAGGRTISNELIFSAFWEQPSNSHTLIAVHTSQAGQVLSYSFAVPAPSDYKHTWSTWRSPQLPEGQRNAPLIRYRLEFQKEWDDRRNNDHFKNVPTCSSS
jgi:hypothetical protein